MVDCVWNVMAHMQKPDFVFQRNGRVHLNQQRCQFSRLLAAEVCASAVVMLDTPCSEVVWRVLATHSIRQFPLHPPLPPVHHHVPSRFNWTLLEHILVQYLIRIWSHPSNPSQLSVHPPTECYAVIQTALISLNSPQKEHQTCYSSMLRASMWDVQ